MKINVKNEEKITAAIRAAEGRSTVRTVSYSQIIESISTIEKKLDIPKVAMTGIVVDVDINAQDFPNAYKYVPMSTQFTIEKTPSGWFLVGIARDKTKRYNQRFYVKLTDEAKQAIVSKYTCFTW